MTAGIAMTSDDTTVAQAGLDIGAVRTKIAFDPATPVWHGPSPIAGSHRGLLGAFAEVAGAATPARLLTGFLSELLAPAGPVPVKPGRTAVVAAVPDAWIGADAADTWTAPGSTPVGRSLHRLLTEDVGFASARLVPGLQCAAATYTERRPESGCLLLCDIGSSTVDTAVYVLDGATTRLLDADYGNVADSALRQTLLKAADDRGAIDDPARIAALEDERCRRAHRVRLVWKGPRSMPATARRRCTCRARTVPRSPPASWSRPCARWRS